MATMIDREAPLSGLANLMALKGRQGDTELVHMTKPEIRGLASLGQLTINPDTGLPEAFNFKSLLPAIAGMAANFIVPGSGFLIPALAAGVTSAAVNKGDIGAIAFDSLLAGAGAALGGATIGAETATTLGADLAANEAMAQAANTAVKQAAAKGLTAGSQAAAGQLATEGARVGLTQAIPEMLGSSAGTKILGDITAGQLTGAALRATPTLAAGALGMPMSGAGMLEAMQPPEIATPARKSAESAYGTRAAEEIKQTPQAMKGLTTEDILKSSLGQGDPIKYFQSGAATTSSTPSGVYGTPKQGIIGQPVRGVGPIGSYVPAANGGGIQDLYDRMGGGYEQFRGLVEGGGVDSDGMSDDIAFRVVKEEEDDPDYALLSPDEYVIDAHTVAALGNGSTEAGTRNLDNFVANLRKKVYNKGDQPKQIDGLRELAILIS